MREQFVPAPDEVALRVTAEQFGTKFAVQKLFYELGMCGIETRLFEPSTPTEKIAEASSKLDVESRGAIVRFSFRDALNLPRGFFKTRQECIDFIHRERKDYAVIVQEYTQLVNSFELYSDGSLFYLQVLPGIWEVDTTEAPDIIREKGGNLSIWRFRQPRKGKFVNNGNSFSIEERPPFSFAELKELYDKLDPYKERLEAIRKLFNPLFCHFYEDHVGRLCFINVRNVGQVPINEDSPSLFYTIKNAEDIDNWNGSRPILFDVQSERDNDTPLVAAINSLHVKGIKTVHVNYGILSHPAILLREAGIEVKQSYSLYEKQIIPTQTTIPQTKETFTIESMPQKVQVEDKNQTEEAFHKEQEQEDKAYTIWLENISNDEFDLVGGKAYNLSKLTKAGFLVPRAFIVTTLAFQEWLKQQKESYNVHLPDSVVNRIFQGYRDLNADIVAVRSSATVEDLLQASSAGVYKTSLNVTKERLIEAIIEVFQSFYDPNAQAYRLYKSIGEGANMAVIVQEMIGAEIAGVLFTHNPLNHNPDEFVLNATFGLGEPLVSGKVPGDTYVINRESGEVIETTITEKDTVLTLNGVLKLAEPLRSNPTLSNSQIAQLVKLGNQIEELFAAPQDMEFAVIQNKIWVLQSRPITQHTR